MSLSPGRQFLGFVERNAVLLTVLGLLFALVPRLLWSLWVDETGTFWMARGGAVAAVAKTWNWPGQSLLFSAITSLFCFDGFLFRDFLLRVPALAGGALLCFFLYRFAEDALGSGAGRIAAVLAAFHPMTIEFSTQARPYSLAMAAVTASCWTLFRWVRDGERRWLVWWIVSSALVIYLHYLFAVVFLAQFVYIVLTPRRIPAALLGFAIIGLLCLPIALHIELLFRDSGTLPFGAAPRWRNLAGILVPRWLAAGLAIAALLVFRSRPALGRWKLPALSLILCWWLAGPFLLFEVSRHSAMRMFVGRYVGYSGPAAVLLLTVVGFTLFGAKRGLAWAVIGGLLATAVQFRPGKGAQELGPVLTLVRQESAETPLLFCSLLVEANAHDWRAGNAPHRYLYAPLEAYPVPNRLVPLPNFITEDVRSYVRDLAVNELSRLPRMILVTQDQDWLDLVSGEMEKFGFTHHVTKPNDFMVIRFEKNLGPESRLRRR
jgi:hypothetical protein